MVSVQVIDKSSGRYRLIKTIGSSSSSEEVERLYREGIQFISHYGGQTSLQDILEEENETVSVEQMISNISNILINGTQIILDKVYKNAGFDQINDDVLKQLVIARLSQPVSKLGTVEYLKLHCEEGINLSKIYRYLDKLYNTQQEIIQQISIETYSPGFRRYSRTCILRCNNPVF
jgi:hypothetical protein